MTKSEIYFSKNGYKQISTKKCENCGKEMGIFLTRDLKRKRFCSRYCFGKINAKEKGFIPPRPTPETRKKILESFLKNNKRNGVIPWLIPTVEGRRKAGLKIRGENHPKWIKDRKRVKRRRFNNSERKWAGGVVAWRNDIFRRDNYTCQHCFQKGGKLNAHHILSWDEYPDKRFDVKNGITLCRKCHLKEHRRIKEKHNANTKTP